MHRPAVICAAGQGHARVLALLLDSGVPVDAAYENRLTALMWAAGQGQGDAVDLLLARGAAIDLRDDRGKTAADIAQEAGHASIAARLAVQKR